MGWVGALHAVPTSQGRAVVKTKGKSFAESADLNICEIAEPSMRIHSVNVGLPEEISDGKRTIVSGIYKTPVGGRVMARRLNLDGDGQADLEAHGGEQRAIYAYPWVHFHHWARRMGRDGFPPGAFGENLTLDDVTEEDVCIGDRFRVTHGSGTDGGGNRTDRGGNRTDGGGSGTDGGGSGTDGGGNRTDGGGSGTDGGGKSTAVLEVTQPRPPCYKLEMRLAAPGFAKTFLRSGRVGFYLRVITEGEIGAGDEMERIAEGPERMSVRRISELLHFDKDNLADAERALRIPALSPGWRDSFRKRVGG